MILVTGAAGCLGSSLTRHLVERGEKVAILRLGNDSGLSNLGPVQHEVEHRIGDVRNPDSLYRAFRGIHRLYHLAGIATPDSALARQMHEVNVLGTENVLNAARACGIERVVYTSSSAAIGIPPDGVLADETYEYNGQLFRFPYMHSKRRAEEIALQHARAGLNVVIVNPTAVMAPGGDPRSSWSGTISAVERGLLRFYPAGGVAMVTRADMVNGHIGAMETGHSGERYLLNTVNITYRDLITLVAQGTGARPPLFQVPGACLSAAGSWNTLINRFRKEGSGSLLTRDNVPLLKRRVYYDQSKAIRELGLTQTPLIDAVIETAEWWHATARR